METEQRRRSDGSSKTSKKNDKRLKAKSAEEEAKRREAIKEALREKLELEKRARQVVERLLDDSVTEDFLIDCARFITPANYKDAVEERFIAKMCGYPVCPSKLGKIPTQQFKISTKTNKVYDITERKCFCSNFCYKASKEFELQISKTPLWLRQHESPPEITLMKKGDSGSSGEEVKLTERRLQEEDIENPLIVHPQDTPSSEQRSASPRLYSDSSEDEQEQDFVSSVVSQRQGPRVHWGDLPKRTDKDKKQGETEKSKKQNIEETEEEKMREEEDKQTGGQRLPEDTGFKVEDAAAQLSLCSLAETVTPNTTQTELTSTKQESNTSENSHSTAQVNEPGLNITQVGMSKRGAAGLRDLLKNQSTGPKPDSIRLRLIACLTKTLKEWSTDDTLTFLYGPDHSLGSPFADVKEEEEELDEDDIEDDVTQEEMEQDVKRPSAAAPDYKTLQKETEQLDIRVKEFYKGTWILPDGNEQSEVTVKDQNTRDPVLPLIDSQAQHLIQKRITVEKLTSCLRNIVGSLRLTMSDISTDLNNLVRTFRFTNTNISHKIPEWTLIAVVLLHLLSEVSPLVREALKMPSSTEYLNTLMEDLGLQEHDLLDLMQKFKTQTL
ncbi:putative RNA polymerase II subunit B1 CTD phosphatase rpap2 [Sphaeramia orbicularis]|uniref:RNA polymerase II subunit B1 CTD phosphatase RPAP2 homolog n=1 Tax=Sphaeramia orbicularis TaxID=375764 RepID=A0A672Z845_9TELE|nr:putative RNA polymerase II subunit B1 CTD phosphatase RPAP2 [Sphaeramia orbicularis]